MWLSGFLFTDVLPPTFACSASFLCLRAATFLIRLWGWRREGDGEEGREPRNDKRRKEGRKGGEGEGRGGEGREGEKGGEGGKRKRWKRRREVKLDLNRYTDVDVLHSHGCSMAVTSMQRLPPCVSSSAGVFPKAAHFSQFADTQYNSTDIVRCI